MFLKDLLYDYSFVAFLLPNFNLLMRASGYTGEYRLLVLSIFRNFRYLETRVVPLSCAVFTLGRNMISLITNETCFAMKSVHIRRCIARIMIETCLFWSWLKQPHEVVSIMIRLNTLKIVDYAGEGEWPKDPKLGLLWGEMLSWNMGQWTVTAVIISDV